MPQSNTSLSSRIARNPKYYPFFKDCIGALDGSHISAFIPLSKQAAWRNRKGSISQILLAACDIDIYFVYILAGWEGTANDRRVLNDATNKGFIAPSGKYYLADAGYSTTLMTLVLYRGVRYHLKEQAQQASKLQTKQELFNLRHSSLRNIIELLFGVIKRRFRILQTAPEHPMRTQVGMIYALTALNNFIYHHNNSISDNIDNEITSEEASNDVEDKDEEDESSNHLEKDSKVVNAKREDIATQMWIQYRQHID